MLLRKIDKNSKYVILYTHMTQRHNDGALAEISRHSGAFAFWFIVLFVATFLFLAATDSLPDNDAATDTKTPQEQTTPIAQTTQQPADTVTNKEEPIRVVAPAIKLDIKVNNPQSTDIDVLNTSLLTGASRYPTSALLGEEGTVLLFGHSSYLPVVHNQNFKAFNGIQNLKEGDTVSVYSADREYRYTVTSVKLMSATTDEIELPPSGKHLALVTCDSFGLKSDRFVVRADFVEAVNR